MKLLSCIGLVGLLFFLRAPSLLQAQSVILEQVTPPETSIGWITSFTQDQQGYLWFTSFSGLYHYDGYQLTHYVHDPANPHSVAGGWLEGLYADRDGIIWVGTMEWGLDRLDPATGIFTHFSHRSSDPTSLSNNKVTVILEDHQGSLWIGTHGGLNRLDRKSGQFIHYRHNPQDSTSLSNDQVWALYEDRQGTLWVGTGSYFAGESPVGAGGLNRMDRKTGTFQRYLHDPKDPHSLADNHVRVIFEDSRGTFWVGTFGDGLHTMDRQKGTFQRPPPDLYD